MSDIVTILLPRSPDGYQWSPLHLDGVDGDVVLNQGDRFPIYVPAVAIPDLIEALSRFVPEPTNVVKLSDRRRG